MRYQIAVADTHPSIPNKLMELAKVQILGAANIDDIDFIILDSHIGVIALDIMSGFYYPFKSRWRLIKRLREKKVWKGFIDGCGLGELVKCSFILGRDEGQKRLRTVVEIPTDWKILLLSGGGIRVKDSSGRKTSALSLLESKGIMRLKYDKIAKEHDDYNFTSDALRSDKQVSRECYHFIEEELNSTELFNQIVSSSKVDESESVNSVRDELNSITVEQEMSRHKGLDGPTL